MKNKIDWEKIKVMIVEAGMEDVFEMTPEQVKEVKMRQRMAKSMKQMNKAKLKPIKKEVAK